MPENTSTDHIIHTIATRMEIMHGDMGEMKEAVKGLTNAVTKLALIEERQTQSSLALERAFKVIEKIETRLDALEQARGINAKTAGWVEKALWAAAATGCYVVLKKVGAL